MLNSGIVEIDLHGLNCELAKNKIDQAVKNADRSVYRIRLIHGYHGGTNIKRMIQEEYSFGREEKVKKVCSGDNPGITELVLREY